jgi:Zn-dependent protease
MRAWGVPLSIHWSLILLMAWLLWGRSMEEALWALAFFAAVYALVILHELGHVYMTRRRGLAAKEIILWPFGGVAISEALVDWRNELCVSGTGPAVNVILGPVLFLLWYAFGYWRGGEISRFLWSVAWMNVYLLLLNILPIWPLDGGKVAFAALRSRLGHTRSRLVSALTGMVCIVAALAFAWYSRDYVLHFLLLILLGINVGQLPWCAAMMANERRHGFLEDAKCPHCGSRALAATTGTCEFCGVSCNLLVNEGRCWNCQQEGREITCPYCRQASAVAAWKISQ